MPSTTHTARHRRRAARAAIAAAAALGTLLAGCSSDHDHTTTEQIPAAPDEPRPVTVDAATTTTVNLAGGAHLIVPPGAITDKAVIRATYKKRPDGNWDGVRPTAAPVGLTVQPSNAIHGLLTLEFPTPKAAAGATPHTQFGVSTYDARTKTWTPFTSTYDDARHMVVAQIPHFSWWNPFSWDWAGIGARVNQNVGQALGRRAGEPHCTSTPPNWVSSLNGVTRDAAVAVRSCAQNEDGILDIQMVNNRPYGMVLTYGSDVKWGWHEKGDSTADKARNALGDALISDRQLYLPPLSRASVGIPRTEATRVPQFAIAPTAGSLFADFITQGADFLLGAVPRAGHCTSQLAHWVPDQSPTALRDTIVSAGECLKDAYLEEVRSGRLDKAKVDELAARLDALSKASILGRAWTIYGVEWQFADLFIDRVLISDAAGLGAGFSVLAHRPDAPAPTPTTPTPSAAPSPPPPTKPDTPQPTHAPPPPPPTLRTETVGGPTHTWTNYTNAGGREGATVAAGASVQITCKLHGFAVENGNTWWYRIASDPWNNAYYASADAFYNNGATTGPLKGTPWVDNAVPDCAT
ncbi:hypothetical protein ACIRPJ_33220 [Streptomyces asoensis]|uniref:hypothetical protein n=1 Tax=Streptomyces asoensis TaxID=249586 RepID=UPI00167A00BB|nr:hypothetical protein [Streptomyces asoensis]GGQ97398.1 hypothetical protein GCM10010496_72900 [Streptomyces asoensis]